MRLVDRYRRPLTGLRISLTDECDYKCIYCHKEGLKDKPRDEMRADEIAKFAKVATKFDIYNVKLTGGEPLLRRDIVEIVRKLKEVGIREVSITTNGHLLYKLAEPLKEAGLARVNVNLPSLKPEVYRYITGVDKLDIVVKGIEKAYEVGLRPVKINFVVLKGINDSEVNDMMEFVEGKDMVLQLIELEPSNPSFYLKHHMSLNGIEKELINKAEKIIKRSLHNRLQFVLKGGVTVEVVKPMHNTSFCMGCTRLRVTPDGKLKTCLFRNDNLVDFLALMRKGASEEELGKLIVKANELREPFFKKGVSDVPASI